MLLEDIKNIEVEDNLNFDIDLNIENLDKDLDKEILEKDDEKTIYGKNIGDYYNNDNFSDFIRKIKDIEICTKEEEEEYFKKIRNGDKEAYDEFIERNQKLVVSVAKKYNKVVTGYTIMDLIQEGNLGLIRAIKDFEIERGYKFSTYAVNWIKQSIMRSLDNAGYGITIPTYAHVAYLKAMREASKGYLEDGKEKTWNEIKGYLEESIKSEQIIKGIENYHNNRFSLSIDTSLNNSKGDEINISEILEDKNERNNPEIENINIQCKEDILKIIDELLTEREKAVVLMRFGFETERPMTLDEIAKYYGVTKERIRQIESKSIKKLRKKSWGILKDYWVGI